MSELKVKCLEPYELADWPQRALRVAGFTALDSWHQFIRQIYGYEFVRLEARKDNRVMGLLTLTEVRHPIFGNYLTTAPFASYGGFVYETEHVRDTLLKAANDLRHSLGVDYVVVRFDRGDETPPVGWEQHPVYATYLVDLKSEKEALMTGFSSNHRNHIRKSERKGFKIRFGHLELLDDAYEGLARSMHELGSPYHQKNYLYTMAKSLKDTLEFAVVYDSSGELVGSGVFIKQWKFVTNLHANILKKYRPDYAGEYFYWSVIERYCQDGMKTFDLGRSLIKSGNENFKMKWKPHVQHLSYWYALSPGISLPDLNQKNPKLRLAIKIWQRLPRPVVRLLGSSLIRGLA